MSISAPRRAVNRLVLRLTVLLLLGVQCAGWASTIYVSEGAAGNGSASYPYGTIQAGVNAAHPGDTVLVAPGTYREQVVVGVSGTASAPITIRSSTTGAAVVTGSDPVGNFVQPAGSPAWAAASVPVFSSTQGQGEQCFAGSTRLIEARWPFTPASALSSPAFSYVQSTSSDTVVGIEYGDMAIHTVNITDSNLPPINWTGATIQIFLAHGYQQVTGTVLATSGTTLTIRYATKLGDLVVPYVQYFLFGIPGALAGTPAALNNTGEWVRSGSSILVRAPGDVNPNSAQIECKQRDYAFDLSGQAYVTLEGFTVQRASITTDNQANTIRLGTSLAAANHIVLENLAVDTPNSINDLSQNPYQQWTNNTGVVLSGTDNILEYSSILHSDGNGVSLAGVGNQVLNNYIAESDLSGTECAGISAGYNGMIGSNQPAQTYNLNDQIAYNVIERSGRGLIDVSALGSSQTSGSRLHHNVLSGAALQTYDSGAIYNFEYVVSALQDGLEIDHNQISASPVGIYLDNRSNGFLVHHNIVSSPGEPGLTDGVIIVNDGTNHLIANNTMIAEYPYIDGILAWYTVGNDAGVVIRNNILYGGNQLGSQATTDHNLVWDGTSGSSTDPRLANLLDENFALDTGSPAINVGLAISGVTNDTRPGSQQVIGIPDLGAIESGSASWVPALPADSTPPTITITSPVQGARYGLQQFARPSFSCSDNVGGSGVARCTGTTRNRGGIYTLSAGPQTFTVTAIDRTGNTSVVQINYTVCSSASC